MKTFAKLLNHIKKEDDHKTTGSALASFIRLANHTPYTDYEIEDLNKTAEKVFEYHYKEVKE